MEDIHGVDVSWLHHSPKGTDHYTNKPTERAQGDAKAKPPSSEAPNEQIAEPPTTPKSNGANPAQTFSHLHRPHLVHRQGSEKADPQNAGSAKASKDPKVAPLGRRNSWMSSISSKFSSNSNSNSQSTASDTATTASAKSPPVSPLPDTHTNPIGSAVTPTKKTDAPQLSPSSSPKNGHTFIQSALRRLSSSTGSTMGKASDNGGVCPRKTMNVDPYRERCSIPELNLQKLRRVAFCVDVEIAGAAQYVDDEVPAPPQMEASSLAKVTPEVESKRKKDRKFKKGEGAALKHPETVAEEKEKIGVIKASGEVVNSQRAPERESNEMAETKEPTKKKEKKKRSEGERKERKERKHQEALANGTIPAEVKRENSNGSAYDSSTGADTPPNQDRPTTDPLRIYRRCCQLRETPVLKRIIEQISSPTACLASTPGILSSLDLSGYWMQLSDLITLGDYLAVVPVRRLVLENCGLGDEAVRVILAGLLAAKTPEQAKHNKRLSRKGKAHDDTAIERLGVIEKLSLKNNPKITKEGWRHVSLFINMSRSLKAIDLSLIPICQSSPTGNSVKIHNGQQTNHQANLQTDMPTLLQEAIGERLGGSRLEELVMAQCGLSTECIMRLVDSAMKCGITRLGLASNDLSPEAFEHVIRYVRSGKCVGLDLGGNDLRNEYLDLLAGALDNTNPLYALSLADCNLSPSSIETLLPTLVKLPNFRFIDLSHNRDLFTERPTALNSIRKYLPQCHILKRVHLMDVAMSPEHAIALAEALSESRTLAHINILENHLLTPLAFAKTESDQEEACALYASLMAAVRVSQSIVCIDIDVPSPDSSEVVKALAKQVVAYSLWNLERYPLQENTNPAIAAMTDAHGGEKQLTVPDILLHLVGHVDGFPENHDNDEPAPDDDYIVGGSGVVKALDICLNRAADASKTPRDLSPQRSGAGTPQRRLQGAEVSKGKAKEMSKNLLESARKIRARLLPALCREAKGSDELSFQRLKFLDSTLERIIERFENEFPECRLSKPPTAIEDPSLASSLETTLPSYLQPPTDDPTTLTASDLSDPETATAPLIRPSTPSRRTSSPSLASRQAQEEGRMHRFGQRIRRDILRPQTEDYAHGTTGMEIEPQYIQDLRRRLEGLEGRELQEKIERLGPDAMFEGFGASPEELAEWERRDPVGLEKVREASLAAGREYQGHTSRLEGQSVTNV